MPYCSVWSLPVPEFFAKHFDELTARELQQIHIIRSVVFTVGQQLTDQEPDEADFECIHLFNEDESGKVLAYMRLFDLEHVQDVRHRYIPGAWTFGRVAVHPDARGTGLGRKLLHVALEWIRDNTAAQQIVISAQAYLKDTYYSPEGFIERGPHYLESGIEHVEMVLDINR